MQPWELLELRARTLFSLDMFEEKEQWHPEKLRSKEGPFFFFKTPYIKNISWQLVFAKYWYSNIAHSRVKSEIQWRDV